MSASGQQAWVDYLDGVDEAVTRVALALADDGLPAWPATLRAPEGAVPASLRARAAKVTAALAAVGDITAQARDGVGAELSTIARHAPARRVGAAGPLGGRLDASA